MAFRRKVIVNTQTGYIMNNSNDKYTNGVYSIIIAKIDRLTILYIYQLYMNWYIIYVIKIYSKYGS